MMILDRAVCFGGRESHTSAPETHDSIGVGEDGPTHQPIEYLASIRPMPGVIDLRPADANEVVEA